MKLIPLGEQTAALTGFTHKVIIGYADVAALGASATGTLQIFPTGSAGDTNMPAGTYVLRAGFKLNTAFDFSDAGITSLLIEIGDGGDTDRHMPQTEIAVDGTEILYFVTPNSKDSAPYAYLAADGIDAKFTAANGGSPLLSECTSGEIEVYLFIADMARLALVRQP